MLGGLPKLFDKNFVIGFLLPTVLAILGLAWLFPDSVLLRPLRTLTASEESLSKLTYVVLLVYGAALMLMMASTLLYRLLGGYIPPVSRFDKWRTKQAARRSTLSATIDALKGRWKVEKEAFPDADGARLAAAMRKRTETFPPASHEVLPTRFGNVLAAFHSYPGEVYGATAPDTWLRLLAVVPKDFQEQIEDARAQVTCLLNIFWLIPLVAAAAAVKGLAETPWPDVSRALANGRAADGQIDFAVLAALLALLLMRPVYIFAVERAGSWGELVKAAFDCYLPDLAKQLGYASPTTAAARSQFWEAFNALVVYREPADPRLAPLAGSAAPPGPRLLPHLIR
jgi:hypothetical protein